MKIEKAVWQTSIYATVATLLLSVLMQAIFLIAGFWDYKVLLGNLWGAAVAILNFFLLAISVQRAMGQEEKEAAQIIRSSRTTRMFMQFVLAVIGALIPVFNVFAVLIPLLFPRVGVAFHPLIERIRAKRSPKEEGQNE